MLLIYVRNNIKRKINIVRDKNGCRLNINTVILTLIFASEKPF